MKSKMKKISFLFAFVCAITLLFASPVQAAPKKAKLSEKKVTMAVKDTKVITLKNVKSKVKWSTTNKKIVTIKASGKNKQKVKITAKKAGSAKVKAKYKGKTYTVKITVKKVSLDKKNATLAIGESVKVSIENTTKDATWKVVDPAVADIVVDSDKKAVTVTAKAAGATMVKATYNKKAYYCKITVTKPQEVHEHIWGEYVVEQEATCEEDGRKVSRCEGCNSSRIIVLAALDHKYAKEGEIELEATCEEEGIEVFFCQRCGGAKKTEVIEAKGHETVSENTLPSKVVDEPTCQKEGVGEWICTNCFKPYQKEIPKIDHHMVDLGVVSAPTCSENGISQKKCDMCDMTEDEILEATGHNSVSGNCMECGTYVPGFYEENGNLLYGWEEMCEKYQLDIGRDYDNGASSPVKSAMEKENIEGILYIPDNISKIGNSALAGCSSITGVVMKENISQIGDLVFSDCVNLKEIIWTEQIESIGNNAFLNCQNIESVTVPKKVTELKSGTFSGCKNLREINLPDGLTTISSKAFSNCGKIESITIPSSVRSIGTYAFSGCSRLASINYPEIKAVSAYAFYKCSSLEAFDMPDTVNSVGDYAFSGCSSLTRAQICDNVKIIGEGAYEGCSSLTDVHIPSSMVLISEKAFSSCDNISQMTWKENTYTEKELFNAAIKEACITNKDIWVD